MSGKGSRYVAITRQEFEQFLKSIRKPFALKSGTKGIYVIQLSDNVGLAVNSTIGDEVRGLGKASIKLNFVSLHSEKFHKIIYGYKKIMQRVVKKKYLQRSTNWRKTLKDAIDKCIAYYDQGSTWFEKIALPDDMQQQSQPQQPVVDTQLLVRIESIPDWDNDPYLISFHEQVSKGRSLSQKQMAIIQQQEQFQQPVVDTQLLVRIESIPNWNSDHYLSSFHDQVSKGRALSQKQMAIIQQSEQFARKPRPQPRPQTQVPQYPDAPPGMLVQPFIPPQQPNPPQQTQGNYQTNLVALRDLYVALQKNGAGQENLEEVAQIGKSFKNKGSLSSVEFEILGEICEEEGVAVPNFADITKPNRKKLASQQRVSGQWNKVQVGNSISEVYYRGIPTGSISKVSKGFEAKINIMGRDKSLGVFKTEDQAFKKIQKEK